MNALDLFSGIGGFALACERVGIRTVAFCEIEPFCRAVLAKHWPDVPCHDDIRTLDPEPFRGRVDLVCGGFPCQDLSAAGKGAGIGGARSGLWKEMARIIAGVRPVWVLVENVPAARTRGADRVLADLEAIGYDAWPLMVGAWAVGAPHRRDRVWIVARLAQHNSGRSGAEAGDADREGRLGTEARTPDLSQRRPASVGDAGTSSADRAGVDDPEHDGRSRAEVAGGARPRTRLSATGTLGAEQPAGPVDGAGGRTELATEDLGDTDRSGLGEPRRTFAVRAELGAAERAGRHRWPARPGEPQHEWEEPRLVAYTSSGGRDAQSRGSAGASEGNGRATADSSDTQVGINQSRPTEQPLGSSTHGLPERLVRTRRRNNREALKAYGNSICWPVAEAVLRAMLEEK